MRFSSVAALLLALPLLAALACGGDETVETEKGDVVTLHRDGETMTFKVDGEDELSMQAGENVKLPDDFPGDVPVFPNAKLVASMTSPEGVIVTSRSSEPADAVVAFYKKQLEGKGWKLEAEMNMGPQRMLTFSKGERQVMLNAGSDQGQTQISLTAGR